MNKLLKISLLILIIIFIAFAIRFLFGGSEDDWICVDGEWVKHGVPYAPKPTGLCLGVECVDFDPVECPGECSVCPPCAACSSVSCQTQEFCESIGFDKDWYPNVQKEIDNFFNCAAIGNPVMESYPRKCRAGDMVFVENIGNELEKMDLIKIDNPRPNQTIESPLIIQGEAKGLWFFEGDFPVILTDWDGLIIAETFATAQSDWMTEEFVGFKAEIEFAKPELYNNGILILQKDNPSGLPENDDALEIPIFFK